jgi:hypothetical protein
VSRPAPLGDASTQLLLRLRLRLRIPRAGLDDATVTPLVDAGWAAPRGTDALRLTPAGRAEAEHRFLLAPDSDDHPPTARAYEQFLALNGRLLQICHDWDRHPGGSPNDHADPTYDWSVIDRLTALDEQVGPLLRRLGRAVPRYAGYRSRLRDARGRVEAGGTAWLSSERVESYHRVWWDLHEDLLLALGLDRASEPAGIGTP